MRRPFLVDTLKRKLSQTVIFFICVQYLRIAVCYTYNGFATIQKRYELRKKHRHSRTKFEQISMFSNVSKSMPANRTKNTEIKERTMTKFVRIKNDFERLCFPLRECNVQITV